MEDVFYWAVWGCMVLPLAALIWSQGVAAIGDSSAAAKAFRNNYLAVYSLQMRERRAAPPQLPATPPAHA